MNIRETVFNICHGEGIYHQQFIKKKQLQLNPGGRCPSLAFDLNSNRLFRILMQQSQQKYFIVSTWPSWPVFWIFMRQSNRIWGVRLMVKGECSQWIQWLDCHKCKNVLFICWCLRKHRQCCSTKMRFLFLDGCAFRRRTHTRSTPTAHPNRNISFDTHNRFLGYIIAWLPNNILVLVLDQLQTCLHLLII